MLTLEQMRFITFQCLRESIDNSLRKSANSLKFSTKKTVYSFSKHKTVTSFAVCDWSMQPERVQTIYISWTITWWVRTNRCNNIGNFWGHSFLLLHKCNFHKDNSNLGDANINIRNIYSWCYVVYHLKLLREVKFKCFYNWTPSMRHHLERLKFDA